MMMHDSSKSLVAQDRFEYWMGIQLEVEVGHGIAWSGSVI